MRCITVSFLNQADRERMLLRGRSGISEDGSLVLPWSLSGVSFRFYGTGAVLHFAPYSEGEPAYFRTWMDGRSEKHAVACGSEKILLEDPAPEEETADGCHEVTILRVTEGMVPVRLSGISILGFHPELKEPPAPKRPYLEFVGDSITCGYGVLGPEDGAGFKSYEEDATRSYAFLTAAKLHADISVAGASGKGIVANCNGDRSDMTLRQAFHWADRQGTPYDFSAGRKPDAVVVNAGTNDQWGGVKDEEFIPACVGLLKDIRAAYPDVPIVYCYGVMDFFKNDAVRAAVEAFNAEDCNASVCIVSSMYSEPDETGGGGHPNTKTSVRVSERLAEHLRAVLNITGEGGLPE